MGKRAIAPVDSLWLNMDTPSNLMVIDGVLFFDGPLDVARVTRVLDTRLVQRYPVFGQVPQPSRNPLGGENWVDPKRFSITDHIVTATLAAPGDDAVLQAYTAAQMCRPLDRTKPLWEVHLIQGYMGGSALLARFHHAMADGTALARVMLELTDDNPDDDLAGNGNAADGSPAVPLAGRGGGAGALQSGLHVMSRLPSFADPRRVVDAAQVVAAAGVTAQKLLFTTQPESLLKGRAGVAKVPTWSSPHDLGRIKAASRQLGVTINDVAIAALAGAIHRHFLAHGDEPQDLTTMVPVNLRPLDRPLPRELGNKFALVMLKLPIAEPDPGGRLAESKRRMDRIKNSPEPVMTFGIIETLGAVSPSLTRMMIDFFSAKAIGVTTNVPGPQHPRYFAGVPVRSVLGWAPSAGDQTMNACIFSYNNTLRVGFKTDEANVPDPQGLATYFDDELAALIGLAE